MIDLSKADEKSATLKLRLRAKSGYSCDAEFTVSANQWAGILAICEQGVAPHVVPLCVCGKGPSVTELDGQFLCQSCADAWVRSEGIAEAEAHDLQGQIAGFGENG